MKREYKLETAERQLRPTAAAWVLVLVAVLFLRSCETCPASETVTASISVTNVAVTSNAVAVTGVQMVFTNTVPASLSFIQVSNTAAWTATNLYVRMALKGFTNVASVAMANETNVVLYGYVDTPLVVTLSGGWGTISYSTNVTSDDGKVVVYPMFSGAPTNEWTNQANSVIAMVAYSNATEVIPTTAPVLGSFMNLSTNAQTATNKSFTGGNWAGSLRGASLTNATAAGGSVYFTNGWLVFDSAGSYGISNTAGYVFNFGSTLGNSRRVVRYGEMASLLPWFDTNLFFSVSNNTDFTPTRSDVRLKDGLPLAAPVISGAGTLTNGFLTVDPTWVFESQDVTIDYNFRGYDDGKDAESVMILGDLNAGQFAWGGDAAYSAAIKDGAPLTNVTAYGETTMQGLLKLSSASVDTLVTGNNMIARPTNNVVLLGVTSGAATVCGITGGHAGDWLWLVNGTTYALTIANESGFSTAATNRITCVSGVSNVTVQVQGYALLYYNGSRWLCVYPETFPSVNAIVNSAGYGTNTTLVGPFLVGTNASTNGVGWVWTATDTNGVGTWQVTQPPVTNDATFTGTTTVSNLTLQGDISNTHNGVSAPVVAVWDTYGVLTNTGIDPTDVALESSVASRFSAELTATTYLTNAVNTNLTNITARVARFGGTADSLSSTNQTNYGAVFYGQGTSGTILSNNSGVLSIQTSNSAASKITQTASGVGIGTNSPQALVHVVGTNGMVTDVFRASSSNAVWSVRIGANGSLGLGGAAPDANFPLSVSGSMTVSLASYFNGFNSTGNDPFGWYMNGKALTIYDLSGKTIAFGTNAASPSTALLIRPYTNEFTLRMTDQGGNVTFSVNTNGALQLSGARLSTNTPAAGFAGFFAATNSGVVEMYAIDSGGNVTQLSAHPLDAPPVFYITTNWVSGAPNITRTVKLFAGTIEWENVTLTHLVQRWTMDRDLGTTNAFTNLTAAAKLAIRAAMHREESFATYNARMGYTNGDARALVRLNWAAVQAARQLEYDRARSNELAQVAAGATNVFPRPAMDVTEAKPALVDWVAP